jgi:predicted transcriptional regulator
MTTATSVRLSDETKAQLLSIARYEQKSMGSVMQELFDFAIPAKMRSYEERELFYAETEAIQKQMRAGESYPLESILE